MGESPHGDHRSLEGSGSTTLFCNFSKPVDWKSSYYGQLLLKAAFATRAISAEPGRGERDGINETGLHHDMVQGCRVPCARFLFLEEPSPVKHPANGRPRKHSSLRPGQLASERPSNPRSCHCRVIRPGTERRAGPAQPAWASVPMSEGAALVGWLVIHARTHT